ncbi:MAG TPA: long-chain fatty acid--CoA ligase [Vicinamibacterales bacterium]|nr:long-chain fatty acid--CoA ligase [Vicinamibacterales bacterium]
MSSVEPAPSLSTIADLPFHVLGRHPKPLMIGRCRGNDIDGLSTRDFFDRVRDLSLGLRALGLERGDRVALLSESRPEWLIADLAIITTGAVTAPIYPTLPVSQVEYILRDSGARLAVVSDAVQLQKVQQVRHELPALEAVLSLDAGASGPSVLTVADVAARGHARMIAEWGVAREYHDHARTIAPSDLATIIYTSGTTGEPKGVMLTHGNLASNVLGGQAALEVGDDDVALSFLPLSHSFERTVAYLYMAAGVTIVFAESMDSIARDLATVRPTVMTGVPRVYEKFQARILEKGRALGTARRVLFDWAIRAGVARARRELRGRRAGSAARMQSSLADRLVFRTIREGVGGRIRYLVSGSAPLRVDVGEFFAGIGLPILEGYGLTETAPILAVNPPEAPRVGTVGRAIAEVELRIAEDGEILARGPNIMLGYWNKPEETAEVLRDGWLHTGDIGSLDADGYLTITDRKKDLLVTSGGKNVAPQPIEAVLKRSPLVAEAVLLGDRRRFVAALIVPDFPALERRLREIGRPADERDALVVRPDVVALYQEIVDALNAELAPFERIKKIALLPAQFSVPSGELTPTLKVRRGVIEERWREVIDALYA